MEKGELEGRDFMQGITGLVEKILEGCRNIPSVSFSNSPFPAVSMERRSWSSVKRFGAEVKCSLISACTLHLYETVKAELSCNGNIFTITGKTVTHNGWKDFEKDCLCHFPRGLPHIVR